MGLSSLIMYFLIQNKNEMILILNAEYWFIISTLLAPIGFVLQDVVADAMTVEAIPKVDEKGKDISFQKLKSMNISMQMLGRIAIIFGTFLVSIINLIVFSNSSEMSELEKVKAYSQVYLYSLIVPIISISGIFLAYLIKNKEYKSLINNGISIQKAKNLIFPNHSKTDPNMYIILGSIFFVIFTLLMGTSKIKFAQEIVFLGSFSIILFLS